MVRYAVDEGAYDVVEDECAVDEKPIDSLR